MGLFHHFFFGRLKEPLDFSFFAVDMHSHLIPGIDDGVQTMDEALEMIRYLQELGFKKLITTPHVMSDTYANSSAQIMEGFRQVKEAADQARLSVELEVAAEYLMDDGFPDILEKGEMLTFGNNYVLVEMSYIFEPINLNQIIFDIQIAGYHVIIAHAERYGFWSRKKQRYQDMKDRSVMLQLNLLSLTGYYGKEVQKTAEWLLENDMYDVIGTDLHNIEHVRNLQELCHMPVIKTLRDKSAQMINSKL